MGKETNMPPTDAAFREAAVIEVRNDCTHVLRLRVIGQTTVVQDAWSSGPLVGTGVKPAQVIKGIRERLGGDLETALVFNTSTVSSFIQRAPVSTEGAIRAHVQHALLQAQKADLSKCVWTITPMSYRLDDQRGLSEALSDKLNVLVSAAPKPVVESLQGGLEKEGCRISQVIFPVPALIKAFEQFGGEAFEGQLIALLHLRQDGYNLAFYRSGGLVSYAENKGDSSDIAGEVRAQIVALQGRYRTPVRCVFVSSDAGREQRFVDALKAAGSYARSWNACRRLSFAADARESSPFLEKSGANVLAGGVSFAIEAVCKPVALDEEEEDDPAQPTMDLLLLGRPFAIAACILLLPLAFLLFKNTAAEELLRNAQRLHRAEQKQFELKRASGGDLHRKLADLEMFSKSRRRWPQLLMELRAISVTGVELLQIRASDTLSSVEPNPFQAGGQRIRKTYGYLVLEARNEAGLVALETFMQSVKNATQLRSSLHRKRPPRLLNNVVLGSASENAPEKTLFSVEYLLDERAF